MKSSLRKIIIIILFSGHLLNAQVITHYNWPTSTNEALLSDKYQIFVQYGANPEEEVKVLMSKAIYEYDYRANELEGRTYSFISLSYDTSGGEDLNFRVVKLFGNNSTSVEIAPSSYNITPTVGTNEVSFSIDSNTKYISVNFDDPNNNLTNTYDWIKHMLMIYVDPPENGKPSISEPGVVLYSDTITTEQLNSANMIYFQPGYYNLRDNIDAGSGMIDNDGIITINDGQQIYIAGGAFVEGQIDRQDYNNEYQKLFGRGILTGRQYLWQDGGGNKLYDQLVQLGKKATIDGVILMDSPQHGIVAAQLAQITNLKFSGWHSNNDGIRVGYGSHIKDSFLRCVDDFFYNFNNYIYNCVFWAGHNGAILTFGWGSYKAGASIMHNIDIINPEWTHMGNNNGLVASQVHLDFKPFNYVYPTPSVGPTTTTVSNIRIDGSIPGLLNLKPRTGDEGVVIASKVPENELGYVGDLVVENITINNQFSKGLLKGETDATITGNGTFYTKNILVKNVTVAGTAITEANKTTYFDIETATTQNIVFESTLSVNRITIASYLQVYPNPIEDIINLKNIEGGFTYNIYQMSGKLLQNGSFKNVSNINVEGLPVGVYILEVLENSTNKILRAKIVKHLF